MVWHLGRQRLFTMLRVADHPGVKPSALVIGLTLAGIGWFLLFDDWWVNSDGSAYLSVGFNLVRGEGYRLPDGTELSWWDRPAYPFFLTAPWLVSKSLIASIWMSRLALIAVGAIVGAVTFRFTGSFAAAAVAGLCAVAQPWTLIAGGSYFVPDGWATAAVVTAVGASTVAARSKRLSKRWLLVAFLACTLAVLIKETGVLSLCIVLLVVSVALFHPRRSVVLCLVAALVPATFFGALLAGPTTVAPVDIPGRALGGLAEEAFNGSPLGGVAGLLALALVCWALRRATDPLPLAGLVLVASGVGLLLYASGARLGVRNGAFLPCGVALLLGAYVADQLKRPSTIRRTVGLTAAGALVLSLAGGSVALAVSRQPAAEQGWNIAETANLTQWLLKNADGDSIGCTLQYCSYAWLASGGQLQLELLPHYAARIDYAPTVAELAWTEAVGFRGREAVAPPCRGRSLVVTRSDERFGAIFECPLLRYVRREQPRYLMVSAWGSLTFDAGGLIPYLEVHPAFRRVYLPQVEQGKSWQVISVYEVIDDFPKPLRKVPSYYTPLAYAALAEARPRGSRLLDASCLEATIDAVQTSPSKDLSRARIPRCLHLR